MKGIILAGGKGTRLRPLTGMMNKHLLPVGQYPMIYYAVRKLAEAGINDILLVLGKQSAGMYIDFLGSGMEWGVTITYKIQEQAGGIAQALALAEPLAAPGEPLVVLLGDNLYEASLRPHLDAFCQQGAGARVLLKQVDDPRRYGVPVIEGERIVRIEEKPVRPASQYSVVGVYMYNSDVFDIIRTIRPSARGELEITDVNNVYATRGQLSYGIIEGWWTDAGTFASLQEAGARLLKERP